MMKSDERKLLVRAALGELEPGEEQRFRDLLAQSEEVQAEFDAMRGVAGVLGSSQQVAFQDGFQDRVMVRITGAGQILDSDLRIVLTRQFFRLAPAAVAAAIALIAFNIVSGRESFDSPVEAALGLPPVTVEAAFTDFYTSLASAPDEER